jgi:hypothetical protein
MGPPLMSRKPWQVVDPSPMGDPDERAIFDAVGRALTEWEGVEVECAKLFAVFVSARRKRTYHAPAVRAYGSIIGTRARSDMLQLAAESYFDKWPAKRLSFEKKCMDLIGEYKEYANRRNDIAHVAVKRVFITRKARGIYLLPSFYNPKQFKNEEFTYLYVSGDIIHYKQEFTKLQLKIGGLREQLS